MRYANLSEEKKLWKKGYKFVAGLDEAGRGPLAGPVVAAAAVVINSKHEARNPKQILNSKFKTSKCVSNFDIRISNLKLRDSKQLSAKQREMFYKLLTRNKMVKWGIGIVSERVIDKINILEATKLAMTKAIENLSCKYICTHKREVRKNRKKIDYLILDGKMNLDLPIPQKSIIKGDEKVFSCAAASIIAKVTRDRIMMRYHRRFPRYRFDLHKGYGTKLHLEMLKRFGRCAIYRNSFNF